MRVCARVCVCAGVGICVLGLHLKGRGNPEGRETPMRLPQWSR
jgi:hypothetical protein